MIGAIKTQFSQVSNMAGATFVSKSVSELEDFVQGYDFSIPLVNLEPITSYPQRVMPSGAIYYNFNFKIYFLTKFLKSDHLENTKDVLIDQMIGVSESFIRQINKNTNQIFINPQWQWNTKVIRQYTSNLLCGCMFDISLDTACNRVTNNDVFDYILDAPMN